MNTLPEDIIISELFPKLKLSKIFDLAIAYPPWFPIVKKYILNIEHQLTPEIITQDYKVVLKTLLYKDLIHNRFLYLKSSIPLKLYLLTIGYNSVLEEVENDLKPRIQQLYSDFNEDMMKHLDTIFSRTIILPQSLLYVVKNKPSEFLPERNYDFRVLTLFPAFSAKFDTLIKDYLIRMNIQQPHSIIDEIKTEVNINLYYMFTNFN